MCVLADGAGLGIGVGLLPPIRSMMRCCSAACKTGLRDVKSAKLLSTYSSDISAANCLLASLLDFASVLLACGRWQKLQSALLRQPEAVCQ
mmetsp:Transcript_19182/g.44246  ORF Transcript_19182/g.44246 Transcript_19182/m.44246 type:complete len:91 (-) Transcript_19182:364-636(-)